YCLRHEEERLRHNRRFPSRHCEWAQYLLPTPETNPPAYLPAAPGGSFQYDGWARDWPAAIHYAQAWVCIVLPRFSDPASSESGWLYNRMCVSTGCSAGCEAAVWRLVASRRAAVLVGGPEYIVPGARSAQAMDDDPV